MNATKIAGFYPFFLDMLRVHAAQPHRSLFSMLEIKFQSDLLAPAAGPRRHSIAVCDQLNPQRRFDQFGLPTDELLREFVPARVWAWAQAQLPDDPYQERPWEGPRAEFMITLRSHIPVLGTPGQPVPTKALEESNDIYHRRQSSAADIASLLRGMRAYQAKRRKRARRLLAQLWSYHLKQGRVIALLTISEPLSKDLRETALARRGVVLPSLFAGLRRRLVNKVHQVALVVVALSEGKEATV